MSVATVHCDKCDLRLFDYEGPLERGEVVRRSHLTNPHPDVAHLKEYDIVTCPGCGNLYGTFSVRAPDGPVSYFPIQRVPEPPIPEWAEERVWNMEVKDAPRLA